jgi:hypothetical protein
MHAFATRFGDAAWKQARPDEDRGQARLIDHPGGKRQRGREKISRRDRA